MGGGWGGGTVAHLFGSMQEIVEGLRVTARQQRGQRAAISALTELPHPSARVGLRGCGVVGLGGCGVTHQMTSSRHRPSSSSMSTAKRGDSGQHCGQLGGNAALGTPTVEEQPQNNIGGDGGDGAAGGMGLRGGWPGPALQSPSDGGLRVGVGGFSFCTLRSALWMGGVTLGRVG